MKNNLYLRVCTIAIMALAIPFILGGAAFAENRGVENKININEATVQALSKLPGIGKKKAEAIIAYRDENGKFNSVDDLKKVDGIAKKTFEKIKGHITVEGG